MRYLPHSAAEIRAMLDAIGIASLEELLESIPEEHRLKRPLELAPALSEPQLMRDLQELAGKNSASGLLSFLGAGCYAHHIPPAVDQLLLRSEFYTAYTPYQAELSQGTLQAIFEFQTIVCELLGLEVANASMYDGASACAEAVLMALRITRKKRIALSSALHPEYIATVRAYLSGLSQSDDLILLPVDEQGQTDRAATTKLIDEDCAVLVLGYPNFFGCVEELGHFRTLADQQGAMLVTATAEPYALSLLKAPGHCGADIAVAEGQALAVPAQYGGPGVGLMACRQKHVRQIPGRLVGETLDAAGKRGFVLTLSTREQHIRRERATSNICTNHGLIALALTIRVAMLGRSGFARAGQQCLDAAEFLKAELATIPKLSLPYSAPTFNEFVVRFEDRSAKSVLEKVQAQSILAGIDLGRFDKNWENDLMLAVTECHEREDLDALVASIRDALK